MPRIGVLLSLEVECLGASVSGKRIIERPICDRIGQAEGLAEIERLLSDPHFQSPERNRNFLRFVATRYFEGQEEAIKAYTIAVDVFGRPANFDPSTDPIVRIEATRLRAALTQYYDSHGHQTDIRIDLPRGRYVPVFTRVTRHETNDEPDEEAICPLRTADADLPSPSSPAKARQNSIISSVGLALAWLLAGGCIASYILTNGFGTWGQGSVTQKPLVSVLMDSSNNAEAGDIRNYLIVAMSQFQTVRLTSVAGASTSWTLGEWTDSTLTSSLRGRAPPQSYRVVVKYEAVAQERLIWWQVENAASGEALMSGVERQSKGAADITAKNWDLANKLARTLAGTRGVINNIETLRDLNAPSLGNGCILRARAALGQGNAQEIEETRSCLEQTLAITPNDAGAKAELAIVLLTIDSPDARTELSERADKLANEAVSLAPFSDRARYALMISQFQIGRVQAAIETGYAGMELNANGSDIPARLGLYLFTIGRWEEGNGLALRAARMENTALPDVLLTRALSAYRLGRFEDALALSLQLGPSKTFLPMVVEAAAAGQLGKTVDLPEAVRMAAGNPGFADAFRNSMTARQFAPKMTDLLLAGLKKGPHSNTATP